MSARSRFASLRHPAFVAALIVLVVNDHLLKGSGILPPVVTGKLSDFAGLVVAPVLVACVFGPRDVRSRGAAFALVAIGFALVKIFPAAAQLLCNAMTSLGVPWRLVADPTDLVGLGVLPFAWRLLDAGLTRGSAIDRSTTRWLDRALVVASGAACVATSVAPPPAFTTPAYLVNTRSVAVDVRVRSLAVPVSCDELQGRDVARMLGPDAFGLGTTYRLEPNQVLALGATSQNDGAVPAPADEASLPPCPVYAIALGNAGETLVWWNANAPAVQVEEEEEEDYSSWDLPAYRDARIRITSTGFAMKHQHAPMLRDVEPDACGLPEVTSFEHTFPVGVSLVIADVTPRPEGCLEVTYHRLRGIDPIDELAFACVPADAFPFAAGETILVTSNESVSSITSERARTTIFEGASDVRLPSGDALVVGATESCLGDRTSCGSYEISGTIDRFAAKATAGATPVASYDSGASFTEGPTSVFLGRARAVIARPDTCDASVFSLGSRFDAVVVERIAQ